jgi:hypothetical protein
MGEGDFGGVVAATDAAIELVPDNEHPEHAHLWCMKGEAYAAMDQVDAAIESFYICLDWTEGDPELEEVRNFAEEQIMMLEEEHR